MQKNIRYFIGIVIGVPIMLVIAVYEIILAVVVGVLELVGITLGVLAAGLKCLSFIPWIESLGKKDNGF